MKWVYDDGGRAEAGFRGSTGDCVVRAIAIASGRPYREVYDVINELAVAERPRGRRRRSSSRGGVHRPTYERYLVSVGFVWTPTMQVGQGCMVHLRDGELPAGRLVVAVSRHLCAVVDGVVHDLYDPSRGGTRLRVRLLPPGGRVARAGRRRHVAAGRIEIAVCGEHRRTVSEDT